MFKQLAKLIGIHKEELYENNSYYMMTINKRELIDNISSKQVNIPAVDLEATITAGYCVFDASGEIIIDKISMRDFYFDGHIPNEEQENTLKKIVYILHYNAKRNNPKNPIAITEVK